MISFLRGTVAHVGLSSAVIDLNGAGMSVFATPQTLSHLTVGTEAKLFTSMIVREDSLTLFGFADDDEREVFDVLLSVSGVGPRLALAVLAVHEPEAIRVAAHTGDGKAFTKVPGIGPKVAGRIVLELAGKLVPHGTGTAAAPETAVKAEWKPQVVAAMTSLGWSEKDATGSIDKAMADSPELVEAGNVAQILRATLRWLGQDGARAGNRVGSRG
ncbi:Holliday junction branch migration protein RuvA [Paenarthrobacter sp. NPDC089316]|uniref:Holliday junction branch migration protein RuvA n=1 Tax=unclassified Paenarthrobacter TaxID=2634190 RepID=UPI00341714C4